LVPRSVSAPAQEISPEEAKRFWDSIDRLREVVPAEPGEERGEAQPVQVRLVPQRVRVFQWEKSVQFLVEITGARNLGTFYASFELSPKLSVPPGDFVSPGPLWANGILLGSPLGGDASVFGTIPGGVSGDGTLLGIEVAINDQVEESSGWIRIEEFTWMPAGESTLRRAQILGSSQVDIVYQKPAAYLSFEKHAEGFSGGEIRLQNPVAAGSTFPVYLCVEGMNGVTGLSFSLGFSTRGLRYVGTREGDLVRSAGKYLGCFDQPERVNASGRLRDQGIALLDAGAGLRGAGCVAEIYFLAEDTLPAAAEIQLERVVSVDPAAAPRDREIDLRNPGIPLTVTRLR